MNIKDSLEQLLNQAQNMQSEMQKTQEQLVNLQVTGEAGAGLIKITMNGRHDVSKVDIDKTLFTDEDKEMIEDLMVSAINDAVRKIEKISRDKVNELTNHIKMPNDLASFLDKEK